MDSRIIRVRLRDGVNPFKYRRIEKGVVYTISCLHNGNVSFVNVSGSYHSKYFCLLNGDAIPNKQYFRSNVFDEAIFAEYHYVMCMENYLYKDLKIGDVYEAVSVMNGHYETNKISINGKHYKKSTFRTLTKEEAIKKHRFQKLEELDIKKNASLTD